MNGNTDRLRAAILAAVAYLVMLAVNLLANVLPIAGVTTAERSDAYPNLFAPAGITFAIWGLIYLLLAVYVIGQLLTARKPASPRKAERLHTVLQYFSLTCLLNAVWIFAWHYDIILLSVVLMLLLLICLILIADHLRQTQIAPAEMLSLRIPFSVYLGWITVATVANITTFLVSIGWDGFGVSEEIWTAVALGLSLLIAAVFVLKNRDTAYGLTVLWAYAGILYKHISPKGFALAYPVVVYAAAVCAALLVLAVLLSHGDRPKR